MRPQAIELFSRSWCPMPVARLMNLKFNHISIAAYPTQIIIEFGYQLQCNQSAFNLKWPKHVIMNIYSDFVAVQIMTKTNFYRLICCHSLLLRICGWCFFSNCSLINPNRSFSNSVHQQNMLRRKSAIICELKCKFEWVRHQIISCPPIDES